MAPRSTKIAKRSAVGSAKPRAALAACDAEMDPAGARQDSGRVETEPSRIESELARSGDARETDPDEGKFARLAADFVLRKGGASPSMHAPPSSQYSNAELEEDNVASFAEGFLVRKGEARPSMIAPPSGEFSGAPISNDWDASAAGMSTTRQTEALLVQARNSQPSPDEVQVRASIGAAGQCWHEESEEALSQAETAWKAAEAARLAAADAQWQEKFTKALAEARAEAGAALDQDTEVELNRLRRELAAIQAALADRENELARECVAIEGARESWQREGQEALSKAETAWRAEEAARRAAADAQWQEKFTRALAEARNEAMSARDQDTELELNRLRRELAAMQAALADRENELARECVAIEGARESWQREAQEALSKAETAWKAEEAARLAAADAQWQQKFTKALAEARAEAETTRDQGMELELNRLREELTAMQAALADRENELARECVAIEGARASWQREAQEALSKAETAWKAGEAARHAAAKAQWQQNSTKALAEARAEAEAARDQGTELELNRLRRELAAMERAFADREMALARECVAIEGARDSWQREVQEALSKARKAWKTEEAARLAAAEAQWAMQSSSALAEVTARCERAETFLAEASPQAGAVTARDEDIRHLNEQLATAQAALADREIALAQANLAIEQAHELQTPNTEIVLKPDRIGIARVAPERQSDTHAWRHPIRDLVLVVSLAASAIAFYPLAAHFLPETGPIFGAPAPVDSPKPVSPQVAEQSLAVVTHAANIRAEPSTEGAIITTLQRGVNVAVIEHRGNWTLVRIDRENGKAESRQGWVYSSFLNSAGSSDKKPPAATRDQR